MSDHLKRSLPADPGPPVKTRPARKGPPPMGRAAMSQLAGLAKASGALDPALIENWGEIVGPELEGLCRPVKIKGRGRMTLVLSVPNGAAAMRVQYAQAQIVARAASYLKRPGLAKIAIEQRGAPGQKPQKSWATQAYTADRMAKEAAAPVSRRPAESVDEALSRLKRSMDITGA